MLRFLHTSDWQLGHAPRSLAGEARARYADARFEAVERLGEAAREHGCELVAVAGDVFDSNRVDRRTVVRGLDAMASIGLPVYLLPGNHDPLDAASVYRSAAFGDHRPERVTVLADREPVEVRPGVEVVGAPWSSKRPLADLVAELAAGLPPAPGGVRVAVAHGAVDALSPDRDDPARIDLAAAERAIAEGRFGYLALGDRHSATAVAERVRYSGTPEASDFGEERPGRALVVELDAGRCAVEEVEVGRWRFVRHDRRLAGDPGVEALAGWLEELADKPRTALRLGLVGELSLHARARLDEVLAVAGERFASCELWAPRTDLVAVPDTVDRDALGLSGFAAEAFEALLAEARGGAAAAPPGGGGGGGGEEPGGEEAERAADGVGTGGEGGGGLADGAEAGWGGGLDEGGASGAEGRSGGGSMPAAGADPEAARGAVSLLYRLVRDLKR